jgi:hypothetical protein
MYVMDGPVVMDGPMLGPTGGNGWADGWMGRRVVMDGPTDGWADGWMGRRMDGPTGGHASADGWSDAGFGSNAGLGRSNVGHGWADGWSWMG